MEKLIYLMSTTLDTIFVVLQITSLIGSINELKIFERKPMN